MSHYILQFKPRVEKDLRALPRDDQDRVLLAIEHLCNDMQGDVKRLTDFTPEYRLRVGNYRILFELSGKAIVVYRVLHRRDAYR